MTSKRVAVVGAGVAGLVAGRALAKAGAAVTVFEAAPYVGGRCHRGNAFELVVGDRRWSFDLEHGIHGIWRQYRNLRRVLAEEGALGRLVHANAQEMVMPHPAGGVRAYEFGARVRHAPGPDLLAFLSIFASGDIARLAMAEGPRPWLRAASDLLHAFAFDARHDIELYDDVSVADYIEGWPTLVQRMSGAITHSAFFREARDVGLSAYLTGLQSYFVSDKRDTAFDFCATDVEVDLLAPLREAIARAGGAIHCGHAVRSIRSSPGRCATAVTGIRSDGTAFELEVDGLVMAVDPPALRRLRDEGGLGPALAAGVQIPEGVPSTVVRLFFDRDIAAERAPTGVFHGLAADNFFWLHRLQRHYVAWHAETGGAVLECHLYGDRAVAATTAGDDTVRAGVVAVVDAAWPELRGRCIGAHIQRNAPTHVAFGPGTMARVPGVRSQWPNLTFCGDWIAVDSPVLYLERATTTGLLAAAAVGTAVDLRADAFAEPLPAHPPAPDIAALRWLARRARAEGLLPRPGRSRRSGSP